MYMCIPCGGAAVFIELSRRSKDNNRNSCITKNSNLLGFLDQPFPSLGISHLPVICVFYPFYFYLPSPHIFLGLVSDSREKGGDKERNYYCVYNEEKINYKMHLQL